MELFKKHKCHICDKKYRKIEQLMQHQQIVHGRDLLYECKDCRVEFDGMEQMRDHIKKFHSYNKLKNKSVRSPDDDDSTN